MFKPSRRPAGIMLLTALLGGLFLAATSCMPHPAIHHPQQVSRPGNVVRLEYGGTLLRYRPDIDRITFFGTIDGPNLLHTVDLDRQPPADGSYLFYGGCYTWVAPQRGEYGWVDGKGEKLDWPPDPKMDRGPMQVIKRSHHSLTARGPVMRSGLREYVTLTMHQDGSATITRELENTTDEPKQAAIWMITAVRPGDQIAFKNEVRDKLWSDDPQNEALLDEQLVENRDYLVLDTTSLTFTDGIKVYADSDPVIAIHTPGWWLLRQGSDSFDGSLRTVKEAPVGLYLHPGLKLYEAELYGSLQMIAPGKRIHYSENWQLFPGFTADTAVLP
ncbi:MAG TPA: hypothetical protein ENJ06_05610 [Phycisphaeraceae bacterium]|nr:hypothetical protein [Phycisphaeraceae bacterium]